MSLNWYKNMPPIDFSGRHSALIEDYDGTLRPMDEPYFKAELLAENTWQILSTVTSPVFWRGMTAHC